MKEMNKCKNPAMKVNIFTSKFLKIQLRLYFNFKILSVITVSRIKTTYLYGALNQSIFPTYFHGLLDFLYGQLAFLFGQLDFLYGQLDFLYGQLNTFYMVNSTFYMVN